MPWFTCVNQHRPKQQQQIQLEPFIEFETLRVVKCMTWERDGRSGACTRHASIWSEPPWSYSISETPNVAIETHHYLELALLWTVMWKILTLLFWSIASGVKTNSQCYMCCSVYFVSQNACFQMAGIIFTRVILLVTKGGFLWRQAGFFLFGFWFCLPSEVCFHPQKWFSSLALSSISLCQRQATLHIDSSRSCFLTLSERTRYRSG